MLGNLNSISTQFVKIFRKNRHKVDEKSFLFRPVSLYYSQKSVWSGLAQRNPPELNDSTISGLRTHAPNRHTLLRLEKMSLI